MAVTTGDRERQNDPRINSLLLREVAEPWTQISTGYLPYCFRLYCFPRSQNSHHTYMAQFLFTPLTILVVLSDSSHLAVPSANATAAKTNNSLSLSLIIPPQNSENMKMNHPI